MDEAYEKRDVDEFTRLHWHFHRILIDMGDNQFLARVHAIVTEPFISHRLTYRHWKHLDDFEE